MRSLLFPARQPLVPAPGPVRAVEATPQQVMATGAAGAAYSMDGDGERGWRRAGTGGHREIPWWTLERARTYSVAAYRANPMARAIVDTYVAFCVGDKGVSYQATNPEVGVVVEQFWSDPRVQLGGLQERLLRDHMLMGETALQMLVGQASGVTRFSPAPITAISDVRLLGGNPLWPDRLVFGSGLSGGTELTVAGVDDTTGLRTGQVMWWRSWMALLDDVHGDPFLAPILDHLDSYDQVISNLIDRTALARYLVWDVTVTGGPEEVDRFVKGRGGLHTPPSGAMEIHNDKVAIKPQSVTTGAEEDSVASKNVLTLVAGGAGLAKTWLAEPDGANRATSLTMAEPVRRRVGGVQKLWLSYQTELVRYAVDQAVAARRLPQMVTARDPRTGREFQIPAAQTVTVTGPSISASDAEFTAKILLNLSTGLEKLVQSKVLSPEAARIAARKAWEDYVGIPYTADLDSPDANPDDVAQAVDDAQRGQEGRDSFDENQPRDRWGRWAKRIGLAGSRRPKKDAAPAATTGDGPATKGASTDSKLVEWARGVNPRDVPGMNLATLSDERLEALWLEMQWSDKGEYGEAESASELLDAEMLRRGKRIDNPPENPPWWYDDPYSPANRSNPTTVTGPTKPANPTKQAKRAGSRTKKATIPATKGASTDSKLVEWARGVNPRDVPGMNLATLSDERLEALWLEMQWSDKGEYGEAESASELLDAEMLRRGKRIDNPPENPPWWYDDPYSPANRSNPTTVTGPTKPANPTKQAKRQRGQEGRDSYDPDQPRDEDGKWSKGGFGGKVADLAKSAARQVGDLPQRIKDYEIPAKLETLSEMLSVDVNRAGVRAVLRDAFDAVMSGNFAGFYAEVTDVEGYKGFGVKGDQDGLLVSGRVYPGETEGEALGMFRRAFYRDKLGDLIAVHAYLSLSPHAQGQGFATAFNGRLEAWYRSQRVIRIDLNADIDVGGYAQARAGYDFVLQEEAEEALERLRDQIERADARAYELEERAETDPEAARQQRSLRAQIEEAQAILDRADTSAFGEDDYPSAYEISGCGHSARLGQEWIGRSVMMGSDWLGTKWM